MNIKWAIFIILSFLILSCDKPTETSGTPDSPDTPDPNHTTSALTDYIFKEDTIRTYELLIPQENLDSIDSDPVAEQYVEARFIVEHDTIGPVGVRYKGNEGAWWNCVTMPPVGGEKVCEKLSMKIKINWNRDTTFYGLKKFQLHSMNTDNSQLRERLGYWFYRQMGVAVPRVVHVLLKINGKYAGLFAHIEQIDGRFTRYHFKNGKGNLYKEVWPITGDGRVNSDSAFQSALETNEDNAPDFRLIRSFGQELESADQSSVLQVIQKWMDVEKTLSLAAVSYTLDDDDGLFHWYRYSNGTVRPHNFYLYEEPSEKKIYLIPWDLDLMLRRVANPDSNSAVELIDDWGEISHNCETFGNGWPQRSAACDKLIAGLAQYTSEYKHILKKIDDGPFSGIESKLTEWENQLRPVTQMLNAQNYNFISSDSWEYAVADLRQELSDARARLREKLQ